MIAKKYPHKPATEILRDLVASTPGAEGKWFAAAKDAGLFEVAMELATHSPTDPRTLARAARDFAGKRPDFAVVCGMAALRWMALGYGYEITARDVLDAYLAVMQAAPGAGMDEHRIKEQVREMLSGAQSGNPFVKTILAPHLSA